MKDSISVFPDTNIFLHFPPISNIDWLGICGSNSVEIVVCLTVINELDDKKSEPRLAARASRAIKEIRDASKSGEEIRKGVSVMVFNREARREDFPDNSSYDNKDDRIVHAVNLYKSEMPSRPVAILTGDYGMELRAEGADIVVIQIDPSLRLKHPKDELTKKYHEAITELNSLKNRQPKLTTSLSKPGSPPGPPRDITFEVPSIPPPLDIEAEMRGIKKLYPKKNDPKLPKNSLNLGIEALSVDFPIARARYNSSLEKFYKKYREHLEMVETISRMKTQSFEFDIWLSNEGNGIASDIDVVIKFPSEVLFIFEKGRKDAELLEMELKPPEPPEQPNHNDFLRIGKIYQRDMSHLLDYDLPRDLVASGVSVEKEAGLIKVHRNFIRVKHGHNVCLGKFIGVFGPESKIKPFKAQYTISTSELPEKDEGNLSFRTHRKPPEN